MRRRRALNADLFYAIYIIMPDYSEALRQQLALRAYQRPDIANLFAVLGIPPPPPPPPAQCDAAAAVVDAAQTFVDACGKNVPLLK